MEINREMIVVWEIFKIPTKYKGKNKSSVTREKNNFY